MQPLTCDQRTSCVSYNVELVSGAIKAETASCIYMKTPPPPKKQCKLW